MALTLRSTKGSALTHDELDANFSGLADGSLVTAVDASVTNFTPSGTGGSTRTVQAKLRDVVSVKDFGAVGDADANSGAGTDDTTAIQNAINSTGSTGDRQFTVYFPPGTYKFTTLTVPEGVHLQGAGPWKTKLHSSSASTAVTFSSGGTYDYPPIVSDMTLYQSGAYCIDTGGVSGAIIRDCWFGGTTGINVSGTADIQIIDNVFDATSNGIKFTAGSVGNNVLIANNFFTGNAYPIELKNARDVKIIGNSFRGDSTHNIHILFNGSSSTCTAVLIEGNTFYTQSGVGASGSLGIKLDGTLDSISIVGNNFDGTKAECIYCASGTATNITIAENQFAHIGTDAISFTNTGDGVAIRNNNFNTSIAGKAINYNVSGGAVEIQGNRVRSANTSATTGLGGSAFDINQAGNAVLSDNVLTSTDMTNGILIRSGVTLAIMNGNYVSGATTNNYNINVNPEKTLFAQSCYGNNVSYFNAAPTGGTWLRGDVVWHISPSIGGNVGWVCTTAGTPGTWAPFGYSVIEGSATYDPASLADGAGATTTVTVTGAALGDFAEASFSLDLQGITLTAWVSATDTVSVRFQNESGGVLDLASGTLRARVRKA